MNLPSKWKTILIRLSEAMIFIVALLAAWVLWLWIANDGGFEAVYVAIGVLLAGLFAARRWLKQQPETLAAKADLLVKEFSPHLREKLLNRMQTIWIEGFLQQSIHSEVLKLTMSYRPDAVGQRAWQLVLKQKGEASQTVPLERTLLDLFNRSGRNLLILGEPGSGKTTTMLQLAEALIEEARHNPTAPIPLVLNLSSWSPQQPLLTGWLVDEIYMQYGLARDLTRAGVAQNQFLYLLDGLDEILAEQERTTCIAAVNWFKAEQVTDMVICSRTAEYETLADHLVMGTAVQIQPLTDEQIEAYLSHQALELRAVRATLAHDRELRQMAQTPLLLSMMTLAYRGLSRAELQPLADPEARRHHLFDHYVVQMFDRRPLPPQTTYSQMQATAWLTSLSQGMVAHGKIIFYIERLQPTWLAGSRRRWYQRITGLIFGLSVGLIFGLSGRLSVGLIFGLIVWLFVGLIGGAEKRIELAEEVVWHIPLRQTLWSVIKQGLIVGLIIGLIVGLNFYGGLAIIQHYSLRWLLARAGILPYPFRDSRLIAYLDAMHERILLRRVGGGWIFVHRSLMEYFAERAPDDAQYAE